MYKSLLHRFRNVSTGGFGRIRAGEVQRMSAGTGIRHSEYNPSRDESVHLLQIWITPSVAGLEPSYEQLAFTKERRTGALLPIASGADIPGILRIHQDATMYVSNVRAGDQIRFTQSDGRRTYMFVIDGELDVTGEVLASGDQVRIEGEAELGLAAKRPTEIVLIDLP